jgi:hypothetical protein
VQLGVVQLALCFVPGVFEPGFAIATKESLNFKIPLLLLLTGRCFDNGI